VRAPDSDGCTLFPEGNWGGCCEKHDASYWRGGNTLDRLKADWKLAVCVHERAGLVLASVMLVGVLVGGWYFWNKRRKEVEVSHAAALAYNSTMETPERS